jgi:hypothetical protein
MLFSYGMAKTVASPKPFSRDLAEMFQHKWFKSSVAADKFLLSIQAILRFGVVFAIFLIDPLSNRQNVILYRYIDSFRMIVHYFFQIRDKIYWIY